MQLCDRCAMMPGSIPITFEKTTWELCPACYDGLKAFFKPVKRAKRMRRREQRHNPPPLNWPQYGQVSPKNAPTPPIATQVPWPPKHERT